MNIFIKTLITICAMGVVTFGGYKQQMNTVSNNNRQIKSYKIDTKQYKKEIHQHTLKKAQNQFNKTEPNLNKKLDESHKNIYKGMKLALSNCQTTSKFNHNKLRIQNLLGNSVGNKVIQIIQPQLSQSFKQPRSTSNKLNQCFISYGKYNPITHTIPVSIDTTYSTPPTDFEAGMGSKHVPHFTVKKGIILIDATLNTTSNQLILNNENDQITGLN